jgi:EmrB/QacA subfamily drug resistance transporter
MLSPIRQAHSDQTRGRLRWYALALLVMAEFVVILDGAIVNVALPTIKTHLRFSTPNLQYVVTAYAITFGGLLLLGGRLADRLGRRRVFIAGVALFTVASLLNGISTSSGELIAFRALQGIGAALLTPAALSLLVTTFTEARERNLALGVWAAAAGGGGAVGLLLGGALTSGLSWRWIFFINVPVGVAVALLGHALLRESRADGATRTFDFAGAGTITGGLMLLVYGLIRAAQHGWGNGTTVALLAGAAALIAAFVAIEWRSPDPLLPLRLFRLRTLSGSNIAIVAGAGGGYAVFLVATLYLQDVLHYSAIKTGLSFLAIALSVVGFATIVQGLVGRVGIRPLVTAGSLTLTGSLVLLARVPVHGHYFADVLPAFLLFGIGSALVFVPGQIGAQAGVEPKDAGVASGLINTSMQVGGAITVAVAVTLATTATNHYLHHHAAGHTLESTAMVHGYHVAYLVLAIAIGVAGVLAGLLIEAKPTTTQAPAKQETLGDAAPRPAEAG